MGISPFLPAVPFDSVHNRPGSYAFILSDDLLRLEKVDEAFPKGTTDLATITELVRAHLSELPKESRFLIPRQINFLIEKHNEKVEKSTWIKIVHIFLLIITFGAYRYKNNMFITRLPEPRKDWCYNVLQKELHSFFDEARIGEKQSADFIRQLDANLACYSEADYALCRTIGSSSLSEEQRRNLTNRLGLPPPILQMPDEILSMISAMAPTAFCNVNRRLHNIYRNDQNQKQLLKNLEILREFWPQLNPNLTDFQKNRAILDELRKRGIVRQKLTSGSIEEIAAIRKAYIEREDRAAIDSYDKIRTDLEFILPLTAPISLPRSRMPPTLNKTISIEQQALAARAWMTANPTIVKAVEEFLSFTERSRESSSPQDDCKEMRQLAMRCAAAVS